MFTIDDFQNAGINITDELIGNAAVSWIMQNTTLEFETLDELPPEAKLFIIKYQNIFNLNNDLMVSHESVGEMSQTFRNETGVNILWDLANQLLAHYLKSTVKIFVNREPWYEPYQKR